MKISAPVKKGLSVVFFLAIATITYLIYDTNEQLFQRDIARLFYDIQPDIVKSDSGPPVLNGPPDQTYSLEMKTEDQTLGGDMVTAPGQKAFLTREEVEYVINNTTLEGCISGYVVERLKELHEIDLDNKDLVSQINAEMTLDLQVDLEDRDHTIETQMEIIEMYQEKDSPIFGGFTGFAISAIVGKIVLSMCSFPFQMITFFRKKRDRS